MPIELRKPPPAPRNTFRRSGDSLAFETRWRSARRASELIPTQRAFLAANSGAFVRNMLLLEVPGLGDSTMRVRMAGRLYRESQPSEVVGSNYLDSLPSEYHQGAIKSAQLMAATPCGLWQIMPVHNAKRFARLTEITAFPILGEDDVPLIACYLHQWEAMLPSSLQVKKGILVETAIEFRFLDVGAGEPFWPTNTP